MAFKPKSRYSKKKKMNYKARGIRGSKKKGTQKTWNFTVMPSPNVLDNNTGSSLSGLTVRNNNTGSNPGGHGPLYGSCNFPTGGSPASVGSFGTVGMYASASFANYFEIPLSFAFRLTDCESAGQFISIFDQYKINYVDVTIEYLCNNAQVIGTGILPELYIVNDNDNIQTPTKISDVRGKLGNKVCRVGNKNRNVFKFRFYPKPAVQLYTLDNAVSPAVSTIGYAQAKGNWIDCASNNIEHYGVKMWMSNIYLPPSGGVGTTLTGLSFDYKYNLSFRGLQNVF